jgi:hypothetical protein
MMYSKFNLNTPQPNLFKSVLQFCRFGILHIRNEDTGNKLAVLVELSYSDTHGLRCRVAHSANDFMKELCSKPASLKLCNREKNIYIVADVTVTPDARMGLFKTERLKMAVNKLNFFRKNRSQQLAAVQEASVLHPFAASGTT